MLLPVATSRAVDSRPSTPQAVDSWKSTYPREIHSTLFVTLFSKISPCTPLLLIRGFAAPGLSPLRLHPGTPPTHHLGHPRALSLGRSGAVAPSLTPLTTHGGLPGAYLGSLGEMAEGSHTCFFRFSPDSMALVSTALVSTALGLSPGHDSLGLQPGLITTITSITLRAIAKGARNKKKNPADCVSP